jgi:hypothetical protein
LEREGAARDIEEMADLCDELVHLSTSMSHSYAAVIVEAVNARLAKYTDLRPMFIT